jgi:hypothetical protein
MVWDSVLCNVLGKDLELSCARRGKGKEEKHGLTLVGLRGAVIEKCAKGK